MRRCSKGNTGVENDHMEDVRNIRMSDECLKEAVKVAWRR